jgi:asparagine synthase (glutamine-hydrolysing)
MCGICGILRFDEKQPDPVGLRRMTDALTHRGPDDSGQHLDGPLGLGHTRLAILDLSETGHQPMASADGSVVIVYNGETYNSPELRKELSERGHRFRGTSDTEVVLTAYLEWGEESFVRLSGMFAMAIWDGRRRTLILVRDRFGIKPLFYSHSPSRLVFGSEIKAILASGGDHGVDWASLREYLYFGHSLLEKSAFAGISKLRPGHLLCVDGSGIHERPYWRVEDVGERPGSLEEFREGTRDLLERAVRRHLLSDVPLAVFLSGGVDSSAVAVLAARHHPGRLKTLSVGVDFAPFDERPTARRLAGELGTDHHELFVTTDALEESIESLARAHDEPFADAANIPVMLLSRQLRELGVKVALQGDGGDELFAGYRRYNVLSHESLWRALAAPGLLALGLLPESPRKLRLQRFLRTMRPSDPVLRLALLMTEEDPQRRPERILGPEARREVEGRDPFRAYREVGAAFLDHDPVQRSLHVDCKLLLPDQFLPKVDRASMSQSIETRVPFLDAELADFVLPIPARFKVHRLQKKFLLRQALRGVVPDWILDGPKRGFTVPYSHWLRTRLRGYAESVLLDPGLERAGLLDRAELEHCFQRHVAGTRDEGLLLYKALNLALWYRAHFEPTKPA